MKLFLQIVSSRIALVVSFYYYEELSLFDIMSMAFSNIFFCSQCSIQTFKLIQTARWGLGKLFRVEMPYHKTCNFLQDGHLRKVVMIRWLLQCGISPPHSPWLELPQMLVNNIFDLFHKFQIWVFFYLGLALRPCGLKWSDFSARYVGHFNWLFLVIRTN